MTKIHRLALVALILFLCTGCDRLTKAAAQKMLAGAPPISLLNDTFRLQYMENTGATLSLGANLPAGVRFAFFVVFVGLILSLTLFYALKTNELDWKQLAGLACLAAGGLGNLIDRLANNGAAVDFMNFGIGPLRTGILNFADLFIVAGAGIFVFYSLRAEKQATTA